MIIVEFIQSRHKYRDIKAENHCYDDCLPRAIGGQLSHAPP